MAVSIIDLFEIIDIYHHYKGITALGKQIGFLGNIPEELAPVIEVCKGIGGYTGIHRLNVKDKHEYGAGKAKDR